MSPPARRRGRAARSRSRGVEAQRCPELGQRYQSEVVEDRLAHLIRYFDRWPKSLRTKIKDPLRAAQTFSVPLQGHLLETALLGGRIPGKKGSARGPGKPRPAC